jgi:hypothetical protein
MTPGACGTDWRERLAAYNRVKWDLEDAQTLLTRATKACETARTYPGCDLTPFILGVELADSRVETLKRQLCAAEYRLTAGRPLDEVLWSSPDDL